MSVDDSTAATDDRGLTMSVSVTAYDERTESRARRAAMDDDLSGLDKERRRDAICAQLETLQDLDLVAQRRPSLAAWAATDVHIKEAIGLALGDDTRNSAGPCSYGVGARDRGHGARVSGMRLRF